MIHIPNLPIRVHVHSQILIHIPDQVHKFRHVGGEYHSTVMMVQG